MRRQKLQHPLKKKPWSKKRGEAPAEETKEGALGFIEGGAD